MWLKYGFCFMCYYFWCKNSRWFLFFSQPIWIASHSLTVGLVASSKQTLQSFVAFVKKTSNRFESRALSLNFLMHCVEMIQSLNSHSGDISSPLKTILVSSLTNKKINLAFLFSQKVFVFLLGRHHHEQDNLTIDSKSFSCSSWKSVGKWVHWYSLIVCS